MTTEQRLVELAKEALEREMSDISEEHYCAGWNMGLEYDLWSMVRGGGRSYGMGEVPAARVAKLKQLSDDAGGWHDGNRLVPIGEWRREYARWFRDYWIPVLRRHINFEKGSIGKPDLLNRVKTEADVERAREVLADAEAELPQVEAEAIVPAPPL